MIEFKHVTKHYKNAPVLNNISLKIYDGEIVVLIGPSGCGKTTTLKMINRLIKPSEGQILINGTDIASVDPITLRRSMGYVIQQTGLFPHMSVRENIEIIPTLEKREAAAVAKRTRQLMDMVGLDPDYYLDRYPVQLSGGQLQRLAIVRALLPSPKLLIADEAVSALDVSIQESILVLLRDLRERFGTAVLFISHDLAVVKALCQRVVVMYRGRIVEEGDCNEVFGAPAHPYTQALLSARPRLGERRSEERILLTGDVSDISGCENGCLFANRCFAAQVGECRKVRPVMKKVSETHGVSCHIK